MSTFYKTDYVTLKNELAFALLLHSRWGGRAKLPCGCLNHLAARKGKKKNSQHKTSICYHSPEKAGSCAPPVHVYVVSKAKTDERICLYEMPKQRELNVKAASK